MWSKFFTLIAAYVMFFSDPLVAQGRREAEEKMLKSLREKMRRDHEMIDRLLKDDSFATINHDFHERFKKMLEDFYQGPPEDFFNQQKFDQLFRPWSSNDFEHRDSGEWIETDHERVLILKLAMPKDSPLDIKIEKGIIHISGKTKRQRTPVPGKSIAEEVEFQKAFPIPSDCIAASARFESDEGQIKIHLQKKAQSRKATPSIKPLAPKQGDITL